MIGEEEVALWHQAVESADALDVYLDWLLTHDPVRGELLRRHMHDGEPSYANRLEENKVWAMALGLEGFEGIYCKPLPDLLSIDALQLPRLEPVLDRLPFLRINLQFAEANIEAALASPVVAKIRRLLFTASQYEHNNYQTETQTSEFGYAVVPVLCASPNITQLEALNLRDNPGQDCAKRVAAVPFVALRELSIREAAIGDDGVLAIVSSLGKTLRTLELHDCKIGDDGARALAQIAQLERLSIKDHHLTATGAAVLRAMSSLKHFELKPSVVNPFQSIHAFRTHCGAPTRPLDQCPLCSITPEHCDSSWVSSLVSDYDVDYGEEGRESKWDHVPPQIAQLESFIPGARASSIDGWHEETVLRCPTCRRLYLYIGDSMYAGPRTYSTKSYQRFEVDALFRTRCGLSHRLPGRSAEVTPYDFFGRHAIVRVDRALFSLDDDTNQLLELTRDQVQTLIARSPPTRLDDATRACRYVRLLDEIDDPDSRVVDSFAELRWREPMTDDQLQQVGALEAIRIDAPVVEQVGDDITVRSWVISKQRLICRVVTVRKSGDTLREDAVIAEHLPVT